MSWRGTIALAGLVMVVGAYLWLADAPLPPADRPDVMQGQPPSAEAAKLLVFEPAEVVGIRLERAGHAIHHLFDGVGHLLLLDHVDLLLLAFANPEQIRSLEYHQPPTASISLSA